MKALIVLLCSLISIVVCGQELQRNQGGEYRIKQLDEKWQDLGIIVEREAQDYLQYVDDAIEHEGDTIVVESGASVFISMRSLFYVNLSHKTKGIVYVGKKISFIGEYMSKRESEFAWFMLWGMVSVFFMIISNVVKTNGVKLIFAVVAVITIVFTIGSSVNSAPLDILCLLAFLFAGFAAVYVENPKRYRILSGIYFILMVIFFLLIYNA